MRSFLDGLPQARVIEDQLVIHDLQTFPGFEVVRTMQHATAIFTNDRVTLTVVMANRHGLEKQLGADLIYRNETFGSFVFVQYKAMEDEFGTPKFRLPNDKLTEELQRMEALWAQLRDSGPDGALGGFRLEDNPFFLKLCPRIVFDPDDAGLAKGMYLPLEYWRRLEADPSIEGPRDGRAVTKDNVGRYLNNGAFTETGRGRVDWHDHRTDKNSRSGHPRHCRDRTGGHDCSETGLNARRTGCGARGSCGRGRSGGIGRFRRG